MVGPLVSLLATVRESESVAALPAASETVTVLLTVVVPKE